METLILILSVLLGVIQITMIIKFFQIASDVRFLKTQSLNPKPDYKIEFYKWIAAKEPEKAKNVLINEISNSSEFNQLLRGGNDKYKLKLKDDIRNNFKAEMKLIISI